MRIVEKRRGELLGLEDLPKGGRGKTVSRVEQFDISRATASRYRQIARHWDKWLYPHLLKSDKRSDARQ